MLLSAASVLVVAQSSSEIAEGLMNNPVYVFEYQRRRQKILGRTVPSNPRLHSALKFFINAILIFHSCSKYLNLVTAVRVHYMSYYFELACIRLLKLESFNDLIIHLAFSEFTSRPISSFIVWLFFNPIKKIATS